MEHQNEKMKRSEERKQNRFPEWDYSEDGYYFITICTQDKKEIFGKVVNDEMVLNEYGKIVQEQWDWLAEQYPYVRLDEFIVMPNHFHGILIIEKNIDGRDNPRIVPTNNAYNRRHNLLSKTMNAFKTTSSKRINRSQKEFVFHWQRSFYDHVIRNEESLYKIRSYIHYNAQKWDVDEINPKNRKL